MHLKLHMHSFLLIMTLLLGIAASPLAAQQQNKSKTPPKDKITAVQKIPDGTEPAKPHLKSVQGNSDSPTAPTQPQAAPGGADQLQTTPKGPKVHARQRLVRDEKPKAVKGGN